LYPVPEQVLVKLLVEPLGSVLVKLLGTEQVPEQVTLQTLVGIQMVPVPEPEQVTLQTLVGIQMVPGPEL
jgi:hypothetical protein